MDTGLTEETQFHSSKITGDSDVTRLESDLSALDGVRDVEVDTANHVVTVRYDPTIVDRNAVQRAVEDAGYRIDLHEDEATSASGGTATEGGATPL